ncbi:hypothetical protein [Eudoraea chungangensis]|uniref:hypothetical protein n=1 Tax=Eudoraea chungangensis TaxID=1481905 RepID=UPI0023EDC678|nr:hypothetical protein [Eudoraea chungangensis]
MKAFRFLFFLSFVLLMSSCKNGSENNKEEWKAIEVTATAYNSVKSQTSNTPEIGAWGDSLLPEMKCIAVSRDLLNMGIKHNSRVKISGLQGIYLVKDKMNKKWKKKIDIFMGTNIQKAKEWGSQKVILQYEFSKSKNIIP